MLVAFSASAAGNVFAAMGDCFKGTKSSDENFYKQLLRYDILKMTVMLVKMSE